MSWRWSLVLLLLWTGCAAEPNDASASSAVLQPWAPIDSAFSGCHGACGAHVEGPTRGVVEQPGASIGQRAYCPVSGAVFQIEAEHPHAEVNGRRLWFCCAGCADYFAAHRAEVLRARGIDIERVEHAERRASR